MRFYRSDAFNFVAFFARFIHGGCESIDKLLAGWIEIRPALPGLTSPGRSLPQLVFA